MKKNPYQTMITARVILIPGGISLLLTRFSLFVFTALVVLQSSTTNNTPFPGVGVGGVTGLLLSTTTTSTTRKGIKKKKKQKHNKNKNQNNHNNNNNNNKIYSSLVGELQRCVTPEEVLSNVGRHVTSQIDPQGTLSSLILVRLSKQSISFHNRHETWLPPNQQYQQQQEQHKQQWDETILSNIAIALAQSSPYWTKTLNSLDAAVDGTKAASLLTRLNPSFISLTTWESLLKSWEEQSIVIPNDDDDDDSKTLKKTTTTSTTTPSLIHQLEPHHLSGLQWAWEGFQQQQQQQQSQSYNGTTTIQQLPPSIQKAYDALQLPFYIRIGVFQKHCNDDGNDEFTVSNFCNQVQFQVDTIKTTSTNRIVPERRQTAWQGDDDVPPFQYSGKSMIRQSWSPIVRHVRDTLAHHHNNNNNGDGASVITKKKKKNEEKDEGGVSSPTTTCTSTTSTTATAGNPSRSTPSQCYYDGCLLNLYPDGGSGMRYHIDPDQGTLWDYETSVVSVGASRRIAFRPIPSSSSSSLSSPDDNSETKTTQPSVLQQRNNKNNNRNQGLGTTGGELTTKTTTTTTKPHTFVVLHGDVMEMFNNCQSMYQHTVKTAEDKMEMTPRVSLVFKKTRQQQ